MTVLTGPLGIEDKRFLILKKKGKLYIALSSESLDESLNI